MRHSKTKQMLDYWMNLLAQKEGVADSHNRMIWPERSDIQPASCSAILGDLFILDVDNNQATYRLAGTRLCGLYGRELKNEAFASAFNAADENAAESWASNCGQDEYVALIASDAVNKLGDRLPLETLLLPLNHLGTRNRRVIGITVSLESPYWLGSVPIIDQSIRSVRVLRPWETEHSGINRKTAREISNQVHNITPTFARAPVFGKLGADNSAAAVTPQNSQIAATRVAHLTVYEGGKQEAS